MKLFALGLAAALSLPLSAHADDHERQPIQEGFYVAPMGSYVSPDAARDLDDGIGATLGLGYRFGGSLALELAGYLVDLDPESGSGDSTELSGANLNLLMMLPEDGPGFYGLIGLGYGETENPGGGSASGETFDIGFGYFFPLRFGDYDLALRAEARGRQTDNDDSGAPNYDRSFFEGVFNLGLHLPLGKRMVMPAPEPEPVEVVEVAPVCSDGRDNDGDGLVDFPEDPGCSGSQDANETNPQCSDGRDNDADGKIDNDDRGCTGPQDDDETDACKEPVEGQPIDLAGCGVGDVVVLRGVHFDFDKARLTANAETILDTVVAALDEYPQITVEISGHTDSRGPEAYNQRLSEQRAASVRSYLVEHGIAADRLSSVGHGESRPVDSNDTDEGRENNRRVELRITGGIAD